MSTHQPSPDQPVVELTDQECWRLLARDHVGRLGYGLVDELHVVPVNYAVLEGTLLVVTGEGNKLLAAELRAEAALEIDQLIGDDVWSVLVRGPLRHLDEHRVEELLEAGSWSWLPTLKYDVIQLVPTAVTGRRFLINRP